MEEHKDESGVGGCQPDAARPECGEKRVGLACSGDDLRDPDWNSRVSLFLYLSCLSCCSLVQPMPVSLHYASVHLQYPVRLCGDCSLFSLSLSLQLSLPLTSPHTLPYKLPPRLSTVNTFLAYQLSLCDILSASLPTSTSAHCTLSPCPTRPAPSPNARPALIWPSTLLQRPLPTPRPRPNRVSFVRPVHHRRDNLVRPRSIVCGTSIPHT